MKVLNISLDKNLLVASSEVRQRQIEYGCLFEQFHILILSPGQKEKIADNVWLYPVEKFGKVGRFFSALKKAKEIIRQNKIDLISSQDPFFTGLIGWLIKRKFKIPWQVQVHTDFLNLYFWQESFLNKIRVLLAKFLIPKAESIRVVSERIKKSIISKYRNIEISRIVVLPIFVDREKIKQAPVRNDLQKKYPQFDFIILMASRLTREKNIGLAIEAMSDIVKKHPKVGLIIVGEGPEEKKLKAQISKLKINGNVKIEDWTDDLVSYYKTADLFLLTSNYEGYGRTAIEAMAAGCPVMMTDVGIAGEILINGLNGVVIPINDKKSLIEQIDLILAGKEKNHFVIEAQKTVGALLTKERYLDLYKKSLVI